MYKISVLKKGSKISVGSFFYSKYCIASFHLIVLSSIAYIQKEYKHNDW